MELEINNKTYVLKKFSQARCSMAYEHLGLAEMAIAMQGKNKKEIEQAMSADAEAMNRNMRLINKSVNCMWDIFIKDEDKQQFSRDDLIDITTFDLTTDFINEISNSLSLQKKTAVSTNTGQASQ